MRKQLEARGVTLPVASAKTSPSGYTALAKRRGQQLSLAFCWSHVRRKFYDLAASSPVATEILRRIAMLYAIEDEVRGCAAEHAMDRRGLRTPLTMCRCTG